MNVYKISYQRDDLFYVTDTLNVFSTDFDSALAYFKKTFKTSAILGVEQLEGVAYLDQDAYDATKAKIEKNKASILEYAASKKASPPSSIGGSYEDLKVVQTPSTCNGFTITYSLAGSEHTVVEPEFAPRFDFNTFSAMLRGEDVPVKKEAEKKEVDAPKTPWEFLGAPK